MRQLLNIGFLIAMLCCMAACGQKPAPKSYQVSGTLWQDSLSASEVLLYVDNQGDNQDDANDIVQYIVPVSNGAFSFQSETSSLSELSLAYGNRTLHIYATPGAEIVLQLDSAGKVTWSGTDSINGWLEEHNEILSKMTSADGRKYVDSVCHLQTNSIRSTLLLREQMQKLNDSLFVRRCLGSLSEEAKPLWLTRALNAQFDRQSTKLLHNYRLPRVSMKLSSDTTYNLLDSRQESLLIFFWADYDSASIDSLHLLNDIARDYGLYGYEENFDKEKSPTRSKKVHKVELMTVCIHAADSAAWHHAVDSLPGIHTWVEAGFAHPLLSAFKIASIPSNLQSDRFSNMQSSNKWGKPLINWLENTPVKYSISQQSKKR